MHEYSNKCAPNCIEGASKGNSGREYYSLKKNKIRCAFLLVVLHALVLLKKSIHRIYNLPHAKVHLSLVLPHTIQQLSLILSAGLRVPRSASSDERPTARGIPPSSQHATTAAVAWSHGPAPLWGIPPRPGRSHVSTSSSSADDVPATTRPWDEGKYDHCSQQNCAELIKVLTCGFCTFRCSVGKFKCVPLYFCNLGE